MKFDNILALSPHTDDIEIGCGGTLNKLKKEGSNIFVVNFSLSKNEEGTDTAPNVGEEFQASMSILGAEYRMLNLECRKLQDKRQEILDYLITLSKSHKFDAVFCHSSFDQHQDHQAVRNEAFRAFKSTTILGYELPWNCVQFRTDLFVKLSEEDLAAKVEMVNCYKSQLHRAYMYRQYIFDIARTRALSINTKYAECFELIRGVM